MMKKSFFLIVAILFFVATLVTAQVNTNQINTGWYQHRYEGMTGSMNISDSGFNAGNGVGYKFSLQDIGNNTYYPNVVVGKNLSTTYQRPTSVRMKVKIPYGYPILRTAVAFGNTSVGDTLWNTTTIYTIGPTTSFMEITMPVTPNGIGTVNQIFLAVHSGAVGGQGFNFNFFIDEIEILVNGTWILIDPGFIPGTIPPNKPSITDPYNGKIFTTNTVCFTWVQEAGLTYRIQVSNDPNFGNIIVDQTGVSSPFCTYLPNGYYWVRMQSRYTAGTLFTGWSTPINFGVQNTTGIEPVGSEIPKEFKLGQNYPNPFNPVTKISFDIPKEGIVTLKVYDMLGKEVSTLVNGSTKAGRYIADFDASELTSGIYFYKLETNGFVDTKKMILIK